MANRGGQQSALVPIRPLPLWAQQRQRPIRPLLGKPKTVTFQKPCTPADFDFQDQPAQSTSWVPINNARVAAVANGEDYPIKSFINSKDSPWNVTRVAAQDISSLGNDSTALHVPDDVLSNIDGAQQVKDASSVVALVGGVNQMHVSDTVSMVSANGVSDSGFCSPSQGLSPNSRNFDQVPRPIRGNAVTPATAPTSVKQPKKAKPGGWMRSRGNFRCPHPACDKVMRCKSDFDKHLRRHLKPFKCEVEGCTRTGGFTTQNDLDRHMKSVHFNGIYGKTNSYQCVGFNCRASQKIWPRLDNFKSHVAKMHPNEDNEDIIQRSKVDLNQFCSKENSPGMEMAIDPASLNVFSAMRTQSVIGTTQSINETTQSVVGTSQGAAYSVAGSLENFRYSPPPPSMPSVGMDSIEKVTKDATGPATAHGQMTVQKPEGAPKKKLSSQGSVISEMTPAKEQEFGIKMMFAGLALVNQSSSAAGKGSESKLLTAESAISNLIAQQTLSSGKLPIDAAKKWAMLKKIADLMNLPVAQVDPSQVAATEDKEGQLPKVCRHCGKVLRRECDMKKHMKRHTKPYGCTANLCYKTFGSKNDWKRHESSQHYQSECYKCQHHFADREFNICGEVFNSEREMTEHLQQKHYLSPLVALGQTTKNHVDRNNHTRFWCGFCGKVLSLMLIGVAGWDERYTHIDHHFTKDKLSIDDWVECDGHEKKSILRARAESDVLAREEEDRVAALRKASFRNENVGKRGRKRRASQSSEGSSGSGDADQDGMTFANTANGLSAGAEAVVGHADAGSLEHVHKKQKRIERVHYCCQCDMAASDRVCDEHCSGCGHRYCGNCNSDLVVR